MVWNHESIAHLSATHTLYNRRYNWGLETQCDLLKVTLLINSRPGTRPNVSWILVHGLFWYITLLSSSKNLCKKGYFCNTIIKNMALSTMIPEYLLWTPINPLFCFHCKRDIMKCQCSSHVFPQPHHLRLFLSSSSSHTCLNDVAISFAFYTWLGPSYFMVTLSNLSFRFKASFRSIDSTPFWMTWQVMCYFPFP